MLMIKLDKCPYCDQELRYSPVQHCTKHGPIGDADVQKYIFDLEKQVQSWRCNYEEATSESASLEKALKEAEERLKGLEANDASPCYSCDDINAACLVEHCERRRNWRPRPDVMAMITAAAERAKVKHPVFAPSLGCAVNILTEEYLELVTAYNDHRHGQPDLPGVIDEALDVAAVVVRLLEFLTEAMTEDEGRRLEELRSGAADS